MTTERVPSKLDFHKKLLVCAAGLVAVAVPIVFSQTNSTPSQTEAQGQPPALIAPVYEVVSIKPNKSGRGMNRMLFTDDGFTATNVPLQALMPAAFGVKNNNQISGAPSWFNSESYDIEAKEDKSVADELQKLSLDQRWLVWHRMIQALLEDRFQFKFHRETKELPVYLLVVAKAGKLHEDEGDCGPPSDLPPPRLEPGKVPTPPCGSLIVFGGPANRHIGGQKVSIKQLVDTLSSATGRNVLDKTGLAGNYDINLDWTPEQRQFPLPPGGMPNGLPPPPELDNNAPSLFTAIQEQLGLKLESGKGPAEIIVIDHVERPSEN